MNQWLVTIHGAIKGKQQIFLQVIHMECNYMYHIKHFVIKLNLGQFTKSSFMNRTEQNRTEHNRTERNRTEQNLIEQNIIEHNRTKQNRI